MVISKETKKRAFKESFSDTIIAAILNIPINYVMLVFCFWMEMTVFETTLFLTTVFTIISIIRKYYVRLYFLKGELNGKGEIKTNPSKD